jgi:hypothetical protein
MGEDATPDIMVRYNYASLIPKLRRELETKNIVPVKELLAKVYAINGQNCMGTNEHVTQQFVEYVATSGVLATLHADLVQSISGSYMFLAIRCPTCKR